MFIVKTTLETAVPQGLPAFRPVDFQYGSRLTVFHNFSFV